MPLMRQRIGLCVIPLMQRLEYISMYPDFATEPRNVRLGLCADGFAPHGQYGKSYSCWPVIIMPYNLPPRMCMKPEYMFLSLIIPGPANPKRLINVYLQPLIEELVQLWQVGAQTYDAFRKEFFMMRATLMWTVNDFPAYGMLSSWSTAGIMGCLICMDNTGAFHLQHGRKACYFDCHRQFLKAGHPYRRNKKAFTKGRVEKNEAPPRSNGEEVWHSVRYFKSAIEDPVSYPPGYGTEHKWTKISIFWDLPYWTTNMIQHNLDVMHIEKNVFDNIFNTVMNIKGKTKDNLNARKDVEIICDRPEIVVREDRLGKMTKAVYTLDRDQKRKIFEWIKALRFPDGYTSNLGRCIDLNELKLHGMKSHDCHVFMERFLCNLKKKVKNKAAIEASICEAYIVEEISTFTAHYFEPDVVCKKRRLRRNDDDMVRGGSRGGRGHRVAPSSTPPPIPPSPIVRETLFSSPTLPPSHVGMGNTHLAPSPSPSPAVSSSAAPPPTATTTTTIHIHT
ncbi:UNVERIFIED_CONTAM: hypothetical protein Sradi_2647900 [Sesamum radiatum]|uniref:DUF4218 domain-containing protein n=1 Tax=Sesamum radiatum TaxID=300843 RepID=A0AAW2S7F5_SESRA